MSNHFFSPQHVSRHAFKRAEGGLRFHRFGAALFCCLWLGFTSQTARAQQVQPSANPAPAAPFSPLNGGLLPPPPPETPEAMQTVEVLENAERRDSGRGLSFLWLSVEPIFSLTNLGLLKDDAFKLDAAAFPGVSAPKLLDASDFGFGAGGSVGVRFLYLSLAGQFRYVAATAFHDWSAGLLASLHIPIGRIEPRISIGGGYLRASRFEHRKEVYALGTRRNDLVLSGFDLMLQGGVDYYVTPVFSVGLSVEGALLFLSRDAVLVETDSELGRSASSIGMKLNVALALGLHF